MIRLPYFLYAGLILLIGSLPESRTLRRARKEIARRKGAGNK